MEQVGKKCKFPKREQQKYCGLMTMCFPEKCYIQMLDWTANYYHQAKLSKGFHIEIKFIWVDLYIPVPPPYTLTQLTPNKKN